jgi:hypothetical protein
LAFIQLRQNCTENPKFVLEKHLKTYFSTSSEQIVFIPGENFWQIVFSSSENISSLFAAQMAKIPPYGGTPTTLSSLTGLP